ncbi:MFS transporter [Myxococcota bacterium]
MTVEPNPQRRLLNWRIIIFSTSWLSYAVFYLTRLNYASAQPAFMAELGWQEEDVGIIITTYMATYACGQFINGALSDKLGPRIMLAMGFVSTAVLSFLLGFAESIWMMTLLYGLNGYFQATGWPALGKLMATWFPVRLRGRILGFWGTNYPAGDAIATALAGAIVGALGWRFAFWIPAVVVIIVGVALVLVIRNHPRDLSLDDSSPGGEADSKTAPARDAAATAPTLLAARLRHLADRRVITLGASYFCIKFVRYTFVFWSITYLVRDLGFPEEHASYMKVPFPLVGALGAIVAGLVSDKIFGARRGPPAVLSLVGLTLALFVFLFLPPTTLWLSIGFAAIGFLVFGPDLLISGPAAMDFSSEDAAATVVGFVNGVGSIGAALSGVVVGFVATHMGWTSVFHLLIGIAALGVLATATLWNARANRPETCANRDLG